MTEPKLCKDCRWAVSLVPKNYPNLSELSVNWECHHPSSLMPQRPPSLVTGTPYPLMYLTCSTARGPSVNSECCGIPGRHWEPIEDPELSGVIGFGKALTSDDYGSSSVELDNHRHLIPDTVTYDPEADVLFMGGDGIDTECEEILPGVILLLDSDGRVTGIEITTASRLLERLKPP